jgi:DNA-binding NarL/FixJ family response regulator
MCTLLNDHHCAEPAFELARTSLDESGQQPQRALTDHDHAIAIAESQQGNIALATARMTQAADRFRALGMTGWAERAETRAAAWEHNETPIDLDLGALSPREIEVLQLVARGFSDRQISDQMFVSPRTVHAHIRNMLSKTQTSNRTELSIWAMERALLQRTPETR